MNNAAWVLRQAPLFLLTGGVTVSSKPVHVMSPNQRGVHAGWSTNANFMRWNWTRRRTTTTPRALAQQLQTPVAVDGNVRPMTTTSSTTVGSPHHRTSKSRVTSSAPAPRTVVRGRPGPALRTDSTVADLALRLNSRNDIEIAQRRDLGEGPDLGRATRVRGQWLVAWGAPRLLNVRLVAGALAPIPTTATMPRKPPAETMPTSFFFFWYGDHQPPVLQLPAPERPRQCRDPAVEKWRSVSTRLRRAVPIGTRVGLRPGRLEAAVGLVGAPGALRGDARPRGRSEEAARCAPA